MNTVPSFVAGLQAHLDAFVNDTKASPTDIYVRLTIADGRTFFIRGLQIDSSQGGDCVMIRDSSARSGKALIIRDSHIVTVELDISPTKQPPIGFHAEQCK